MTGRSLIRWAQLEDRRRRQHASGLAAIPGWLVSVLLGVALAAEMLRRLFGNEGYELVVAARSSSHLWSACAVAVFSIGVFAAPFRLYWRRDSRILASLPVGGRALFSLCLWRSLLAAVTATLALLIGLVPVAVMVDVELAARHALVAIMGFAGSAFLGPAAALAAGAIVASDKAQAMLASMGGEVQAPKTTWLGLLPGMAAAGVAVAVIAGTPWALGERPPGGSALVVFGLSLGVPAAALAWSWLRAEIIVSDAVREVAALDREILAHVERSTPSRLERLAIGVLGPKAAVVAGKDASLLRRRYPSFYFIFPIGIGILWIVAGVQPDEYWSWAGAALGGLCVYIVLMARRSVSEPTEIPRLLATLSIPPSEIVSSKRLLLWLRVLLLVVLAGIPLALRAPELLGAAILVGSAGAATLSVGLLALASR